MKTKEIPESDWSAFFDSFSRQHEGWLITMEVVGTEIGAQVQGQDLTLEGITNEHNKANGNTIITMIGARPDEHITHNIESPTQVSLSQTDEGADAVLAIKSRDNLTTLLRFRSPMLPEFVDGVVDPAHDRA